MTQINDVARTEFRQILRILVLEMEERNFDAIQMLEDNVADPACALNLVANRFVSYSSLLSGLNHKRQLGREKTWTNLRQVWRNLADCYIVM